MQIINTKFEGLKVIKQDKFKDKRGYLRITYNQQLIKNKNFVFEYCTSSRKNSRTFAKSFKIILSDKNNLGLYIPEGFAHAYYSFENENIIYYKLNNYNLF